MGKSYLFISGKGGVGKSTLSAALAVFAAQSGKRVVIIDGDMGLRSLDLMLGLQDLVLYDMADLVKRRCSLDQTLIKHPDFHPSFDGGRQQARPKDFNKQDVQKILRTLKNALTWCWLTARRAWAAVCASLPNWWMRYSSRPGPHRHQKRGENGIPTVCRRCPAADAAQPYEPAVCAGWRV